MTPSLVATETDVCLSGCHGSGEGGENRGGSGGSRSSGEVKERGRNGR